MPKNIQQFIVGFVSFLILLCCDKATSTFRAKLLPTHITFGLTIYHLAVAAALSGILQTARYRLRWVVDLSHFDILFCTKKWYQLLHDVLFSTLSFSFSFFTLLFSIHENHESKTLFHTFSSKSQKRFQEFDWGFLFQNIMIRSFNINLTGGIRLSFFWWGWGGWCWLPDWITWNSIV